MIWYLPPGTLASKFQVWIVCNDHLGGAQPTDQMYMLKCGWDTFYIPLFVYNLYGFCMHIV